MRNGRIVQNELIYLFHQIINAVGKCLRNLLIFSIS
jgi:hypothetical protein